MGPGIVAHSEYHFDEESADRACRFVESLTLPESGKPFVLQPWQREIIRDVFGWKREDGTRRYRTIYLEIPKKNGKSALLSAIALYMLVADGELGAEVCAVAVDRGQADIVFNTAKQMVQASRRLARMISPYKHVLTYATKSGTMRKLSGDSRRVQGPKISCLLFDEMHAQKTRELWESLKGAGLSRRQPLTIIATTAGDSRFSIGYELHKLAETVIAQPDTLPTWYCRIWGVREGDDIHDPAVWQRVNPNWGITFSPDDYRQLYESAKKAGPAALNSFCRYHLNRWGKSTATYLPLELWDTNNLRPIDLATYAGKPVYVGVDLSSITDLTAIAKLFPRESGGYDLHVEHYMPKGRVDEAEARDTVPYRAWAAAGHLTLTDGDAQNYDLITARLLELAQTFRLVNQEIALDPHGAALMMAELQAEGITPVPILPSIAGMSGGTRELKRLLTDRQLNHGGNPLLCWEAENLEVWTNSNDDCRPIKGSGANRKRIDGLVATIIGLSRAIVVKPTAQKQNVPTVYFV